MPYIRYMGRMYNVTTQTYIDNAPRLYTFDRYVGDQMSNIQSLENRNDIQWSVYTEGDAGTNVGTIIEFCAKEFYYNNDSTWPVLRILTTNDTDDFYLQWSHESPMQLIIKANGTIQLEPIPFIWTDDIELVPGEEGQSAVPRFNTCHARVFTDKSDADALLYFPVHYGSFNPNDTTGGWYTRVTRQQPTITITDTSCLKTVAGTYLGKNYGTYGNREYYKLYDGPGIFVWGYMPPDPETTNWKGVAGISPVVNGNANNPTPPFNPWFTQNYVNHGDREVFNYHGLSFAVYTYYWNTSSRVWDTVLPMFQVPTNVHSVPNDVWPPILESLGVIVDDATMSIYEYLQGKFTLVEPPSDVDPEDIPPEDEQPEPIPLDDPDPYYDPESDPTSPSYDPVKDPTSPSYDPSVPSTPYQPIIQQTIVQPAPIIDPPTPIPAPETPSTYVNTSRLFTIFTPTVSQLTDFANFLWASPTDIVPTFRKIVANPMDCVLGLMVMPQLSFTRQSRELNIGNIGTGITIDYAPSQFVDFDCGQLFLQEYYRSYLDYSPYTKIDIFLPFIGTRELSIDECMQKTISVSYRFDLATGNCVAFIKINGSVLYQFDGNCASHIPLSSADWGSTVKAVPSIAAVAVKAGGLIGGGPIGALGVAAAASIISMKERHPHAGSMSGSSGLMGVLYPYLIVTRPCQALPESQNSFSGYPSFITMSLGDCSGYTEVHECHLEHVPATGDELIEIERLLKEGVLF